MCFMSTSTSSQRNRSISGNISRRSPPSQLPQTARKGAECRQTLSQFGAADVAGMPYFVARLEVFQIAVVPIGMGVADDSYTFHARFRLLTNCAMNSLVPFESESRRVDAEVVGGAVTPGLARIVVVERGTPTLARLYYLAGLIGSAVVAFAHYGLYARQDRR